ncbi:hypothetical protein C5167_033498 [Papaver somniferum]|uniref:Uncharacterized protein n=1 Tax=Papaver somniferum TaxID=3469 RepID=A0A4Y7KEN4_PAPSO|nr:hypothetical protein C5167_033498 [Papaver somniferum]
MILRMILGRLGVAWYLAPFFNLTSNVSRKYVRFRHLLIRGKDTKEHLVVVSKGRYCSHLLLCRMSSGGLRACFFHRNKIKTFTLSTSFPETTSGITKQSVTLVSPLPPLSFKEKDHLRYLYINFR